MRIVRLIASACVVVAIAGALDEIGSAQVATEAVVVKVADAKTHSAVPLAKVVLIGTATLVAYTDDSGNATFPQVPAGAYDGRVNKQGYETAVIPRFELAAGETVTLGVSVAPSGAISTIAHVTVRARRNGFGVRLPPNSIARRIFGSPWEALTHNPLASEGFTGFGNSAFPGFSIAGRSPSDTGVFLDGIPMGLLGVGARPLNPDLFASVDADQSAEPGSPAGGLNFHGLEPTIAWQGSLEGSYSTFDSSSFIASERGYLGDLGLAFAYAHRAANGPLNGKAFFDGSGLSYVHDEGTITDGWYARLRLQPDQHNNISATTVSTTFTSALLCDIFTGRMLCGFGPGDQIAGRETDFQLADSLLLGDTVASAQLFVGSDHQQYDAAHRVLAGMPSPLSNSQSNVSSGVSVNVALPRHGGNALSFSAYDFSIRGWYAASRTAILPALSQYATNAFESISVNDDLQLNRSLHLQSTVGADHSAGSPASVLAGLTALWSPDPNTFVSASALSGNLGVYQPPLGTIGDPGSAEFDCTAHLAFVNGVGDAPGAQYNLSFSAAVTREFGGDDVKVSAYSDHQTGGLLDTVVSASALPGALLSPDYLRQLNLLYRSIDGCGAGTLLPSEVYVAEPIADTSRSYRGLRAEATLAFGPRVSVQPFWAVQSATLLSGDIRTSNPASVTIVGRQLPNVPLHRFGIALDIAPSSVTEILAAVQHSDANNAFNLPAYTTVAAGVELHTMHGDIIASVTNLFNTLAGDFAGPALAVPLPTVSGRPLPTIAIPLPPRSFNLFYLLPMGRASSVQPLLGPAQSESASSRISFAPLPMPSAPPRQPFAMNETSPGCTPPTARETSRVLSALSSYVRAIDKATSASGYPRNFPAMTAPDGFTAYYEPLTGTYAVAVVPPDDQRFLAFLACAKLHGGTLDSVRSAGAYVPQTRKAGEAYVFYEPQFGLYFFVSTVLTQENRVSLRSLPVAPPRHPLSLAASAQCLPEYKPIASHLLASLRGYVASYARSQRNIAQPDGWTVTPRQSGGGWWLSLKLNDPDTLSAIEHCASVSEGTLEQVETLGFGFAGELSFAPRLGLYLVGTP